MYVSIYNVYVSLSLSVYLDACKCENVFSQFSGKANNGWLRYSTNLSAEPKNLYVHTIYSYDLRIVIVTAAKILYHFRLLLVSSPDLIIVFLVTGSKHMKGSKECYLLGQNTAWEFLR